MQTITIVVLIVCCNFGLAQAAGSPAQGNPELISRLSQLARPDGRTIAGSPIAGNQFLPKLYAALGNTLAWTQPANVQALREAVRRSWEDGLQPEDFHPAAVNSEPSGSQSPSEAASRDIVLSDAYVRLLYQLYFGKVNPNRIDPDWNFARPILAGDATTLIADAIRSGQVSQLVEKARVSHPLYTQLQALLHKFTQFEVSGGWPAVKPGPALKPGAQDPRIAEVRARLTVTGEYQGGARENLDVYDSQLVEAMKEFQVHHALDADGVIGREAVAALNVSAHDRVEQIRVNLERGRWLLRELQPDMVIVNVAGFYLHLFLKGERAWSTQVIVGKSYTKTPIFTGAMSTIVFNPDWTVPTGIVRNEIFPKASASPGYLEANNYYLTDGSGRPVETVDWSQWTAATFPFRVIQKPGPHNALGQVKFLFPNKHSVYLHDTPGRGMFEKTGRTFSHGCIRVKDPLKLAELILGDRAGWNRSRVNAAVQAGKLTNVALPKPLPVLLLYWTVDPASTGGEIFHRDVYGRDARLLKALNAAFNP